MTMKVYYINKVWAMVAKYSLCVFTLVGSMIVSSCSNEDALIDIEDMDCAISFGPAEIEQVQDQETRTLFNDAAGFRDKFGKMLVCSYKYEPNTTNEETRRQAVFENQLVTYDDATGNWTYSPIKYWDRELYYRFVAQTPVLTKYKAPADGETPSGETSSEFDANFVNTIHNFPLWQRAKTENKDDNPMDLMFAYRKGQYVPGSDSSPFKDKYVRFTFHHVLSQITVQAYTPEEAFHNSFKIKKIEFGAAGTGLQVPDGSAKADYKAYVYTATDDDMTASWSGISYADSYTAFESANTDGTAVRWVDMTQSGESPDHIVSSVCVPFFASNGLTVKVTYTYGGSSNMVKTLLLNGDEIEGSNPKANMPSLTQIEAGHNYIITLKFLTNLGEPIQVYVHVADWEDVEINHRVYNW